MIVFRLTKTVHCLDLSGTGSARHGGRWNDKNIPMIYTGQSRALCVTEVAVHTPLGNIPQNYSLVTLEIPDELKIKKTIISLLPACWSQFPYDPITIRLGNQFILENKYPVMQVPSAVIPGDFNYLINPLHSDFPKISIVSTEDFTFDKRLFLR